MKRTILFTLLLAFAISCFSQDPEFEYYKSREIKTLLGRDRVGGAYCSFYGGYTEIDNNHAVLFGGRFGWLANHSVGVGFGATGFINEYHYDANLDKDVFLAGGYGGLCIEPILLPRMPVHLSFPTLFGAGGISFITKEGTANENFVEDSEVFLIIEPAAEIEVNLTRFFRLAVGGSYRFPTSFNIGLNETPSVSTSSLKGFSYTVSLKFGKF